MLAMKHVAMCLAAVVVCSAQASGQLADLVRTAAFGSAEERKAALARLEATKCTPEQFAAATRVLRRGRKYTPVDEERQVIQVAIENGDDNQKVAVLVQLPTRYDPKKAYPLMVPMGGGPLRSEASAKGQARMMARIWESPARKAGWFVATIADTVSLVQKSRPLRYEILTDVHFRAVRDALFRRYHIDPDRVHATGVSLGSNYSVAYAAAHPDWFAGVVPVSTEGESREWVLRNLNRVGVYVLEGVRDRNIRSITGPRRMKKILDRFETPNVYFEDATQSHVSFREHYPKVLNWLRNRPRDPFPKAVIRVAHDGILMPDKRFFWIEGDTHQAVFRAAADKQKNRIDVHAARVRTLTFHISDLLLDLDRPIVVVVNGKAVFDGKVTRSLAIAAADVAQHADTHRFATARVHVDVPDLENGEKWVATLEPKIRRGRLAFWEMYAMDTLKEKSKALPLRLEAVAREFSLRVAETRKGSPLVVGDRIVAVDGEPMFGASSIAFLDRYLVRRHPTAITATVRRDGELVDLRVRL